MWVVNVRLAPSWWIFRLDGTVLCAVTDSLSISMSPFMSTVAGPEKLRSRLIVSEVNQ